VTPQDEYARVSYVNDEGEEVEEERRKTERTSQTGHHWRCASSLRKRTVGTALEKTMTGKHTIWPGPCGPKSDTEVYAESGFGRDASDQTRRSYIISKQLSQALNGMEKAVSTWIMRWWAGI
jgi:PAB1-binding protein PBP1